MRPALTGPLPDPGGAAPDLAPELLMVQDSQVRDPLQDIAIGPSWLRLVAAGQAAPALRTYRPEPTVAFSARDALSAGISAAVTAATGQRFAAVRRGPGGRATAYHPGSLGLDHLGVEPRGAFGSRDRFDRFGRLLTGVLRSLGVDARLGPVPGEYCPGEFSVNDGRGRKLVGTAQRMVPGGWLFSAMIVVTDADPIRAVLDPVYRELGLPLDPSTVGAVSDSVPGITVADVEAAVLRAYAASYRSVSATVPDGVLRAAADDVDRYRVG